MFDPSPCSVCAATMKTFVYLRNTSFAQNYFLIGFVPWGLSNNKSMQCDRVTQQCET